MWKDNVPENDSFPPGRIILARPEDVARRLFWMGYHLGDKNTITFLNPLAMRLAMEAAAVEIVNVGMTL